MVIINIYLKHKDFKIENKKCFLTSLAHQEFFLTDIV